MIDKIQIVRAVQILDCKRTNSIPLQVLCDDNEIYIIKTMFKKHPPIEDLINEILCNYFFQCWNIPVPGQALVLFDDILIEQYLLENSAIDKKYTDFKFENHFFYGSKFLPNTTEIDLYNLTLKDKHDYKKYQNPLDLIKIGVFDKWIANMDRRKDNPNILIDSSNVKYRFIPIDNTQSFANQNNYKNLKLSIMDTVGNKSILNSQITKSICKFANS
ncbi:HipA family kinase, partial [Flavobacterium sp. PL002]|uniref:HipA family kinase n=4 Tax=unclassified Flavobacterium TaxID=196869 RepID=UPI001787B362